MTNFYVGLMIITSTTVGKIILTSSAGTVISRYFGTLDSSIKGLSYIAMRVALPCLLFTNLCFAVTWEQLSKFYWAPLFGCVPMILGFLSSFLVRRLLSKEYRYVVILASTFQNALTFLVSILINLKGIEWFTGQAVADAQSYVFLYNIMCNIGLYSIGEPLVAWAKQTEVQEEEAELRRQRLIHMGATANEIAAFENRSFAYPFESPRQRSTQEALPDAQRRTAATTIAATAAVSFLPERRRMREATAREQLGWYRQASAEDKPIAPPPGSPVTVLSDDDFGSDDVSDAGAQGSKEGGLAHFRKNVIESLTNGPNLASFLAILVALISPLRWLARSFLGDCLVGGMTLIGQGAIPLQLLVLGCTLVGPPATQKEAEVKPPSTWGSASSPAAATDSSGAVLAVDATAAGASGADVNACMRFVMSVVSPQIIFTLCTVLLRLVILPAACFLLLHLLVSVGLMPKERPFLLAMLTEALSPSAMNSSLICAMYGYHAVDYSRMIFVQYVVCTFSTTIWLFIFVLYIERTT